MKFFQDKFTDEKVSDIIGISGEQERINDGG